MAENGEKPLDHLLNMFSEDCNAHSAVINNFISQEITNIIKLYQNDNKETFSTEVKKNLINIQSVLNPAEEMKKGNNKAQRFSQEFYEKAEWTFKSLTISNLSLLDAGDSSEILKNMYEKSSEDFHRILNDIVFQLKIFYYLKKKQNTF